MSEKWWRVQAFWSVGEERRNYSPVYCRSRGAAELTADEIEEVLCYFQDLEVVITEATAEEVLQHRAEEKELSDLPPPLLHLVLDPSSHVTACGAGGNWARPEMWALSGAKCPDCEDISKSSAPGGPTSK